MYTLFNSTGPESFVWASGIEDTFVPQSRPGLRPLEEYELIGHYEHWREDLALTKQVGFQALRWGVPWYRVEPQPGKFDWSWTDQVIPYLVEELKITPIIDLIHYGTPLWLYREFANPRYPQAVARYAAEFAQRYKDLVRYYTPLNEPKVNAHMCGQLGLWPPHLRGDRGYIRLMLQLARGILNTVAAIKEVDSKAIMVHVEATGTSTATFEELEPIALEERNRSYISYDLLTGRVNRHHPCYTWLLRNGATPSELSSIASQGIQLDILGLNFYPQWSTSHIRLDKKGRLMHSPHDDNGSSFASILADHYLRYNAPVMVTETSAQGPDGVRAEWLKRSHEAIKELRRQGIPVLGYTWFPLTTMIHWDYRTGNDPVDKYRQELGLFQMGKDNEPRWTPSPLVEQIRGYIQNPFESVGELSSSSPVAMPA
jgi:beta-glucosidase/6-phospho-beta-glucosidase/beta-galactosidase